jgi:hypothetical protein
MHRYRSHEDLAWKSQIEIIYGFKEFPTLELETPVDLLFLNKNTHP